MSVVAVKKDKETGRVFIAADSICVSNCTVVSSSNNTSCTKIKKINNVIIGGCGLSEITSMLFLFAKTNLIKDNNEDSIIDWMKDFMDWRNKKTGKYGIEDSEFLIVYDKKIYQFHDYMCHEIDNFHAIGAGRDFALAALWLGESPIKAVQVACAFSVYCRGPVVEVQ